jgi:hypothetical protein
VGDALLKGEDIVRFIKSQRLRWLGHVERMEDNTMPKRMLKGRPRMRWLEDVESDLKKMEVKGWKEKMRDREQWGLVVEEAKASPRAVVPSARQTLVRDGVKHRPRRIFR